jgi:hypothetical protein
MTIEMQHTIELPVTADQAQRLLAEVTLSEGEPVTVTHAMWLSQDFSLPGRWTVYSVRREYLNGEPQHYASLRWEAPVS